MKLSKIMLLGVCLIYTSVHAQAQTDTANAGTMENISTGAACSNKCSCGTNQAPIGVMTDHIHPKGKWMASYSFMNMSMKGNKMGARTVSNATVYKSYMMAPETMNMQMHMAMLMYGVTDRLTIMGMGGYTTGTMNMSMNTDMASMPGMVMQPGSNSMQSVVNGFSDTRISALYNFSKRAATHIVAALGCNLPSGDIRATGTTTLGENQRLPYNMQPGTGSFGVLPAIAFARAGGSFSYGAELGADLKLNTNDIGYKQGDIYRATGWVAYKLLPFMSGSLRAEGVSIERLTGKDGAVTFPITEINDPTVVTANYGGTVVNLYVGLNFHVMKPMLRNFNMLVEYGQPVYQNLNGTQMAFHNNIQAGIQYAIN